MLQRFEAQDGVRSRGRFLAEEVPYNLLHRICENDQAIRLKSPDDTLIFAQNPGHNPWLWVARDLSEACRDAFLRELTELLRDPPLPGVSGTPETAARWARMYAEATGVEVRVEMELVAYVCPAVVRPLRVEGSLRRAEAADAALVAEWLAGFTVDAHGVRSDAASQRAGAEGTIAAGGLYLWLANGRPVSMANVGHRSPRHARINAVYTPPFARKRGYASALVAGLCEIVQAEGLAPMLYADQSNPEANKVYRAIGFAERGRIADLRFRSPTPCATTD